MKNVSLAKVIEKNRLASDQAWLIALNIDVINSDGNHVEYLRVVRNDEQITIDGDVFEPFPFDIDVEESTDGVPTLNLTISDSSQIVQSYMQNYSGGIGFEIDMFVVSAPTTTMESEVDLTEKFYVVSANAKDYVVNWELGVFNPLRLIVPRRIQHQNLCSFGFKSAECAYAGANATCDRTLDGTNGCRDKGNAINFGGFPGLEPR